MKRQPTSGHWQGVLSQPRQPTRRQFLVELGGGVGLGMFAPASAIWTAEAKSASASKQHSAIPPEPDSAKQDRVLVVLQMTGGNDGLNTVVPYEDDVYSQSRPTLRLRGSELHRIADGLGLHPEMKEAARLFQEGRLAIVQGVGYPGSERNHPEAMRDWQTGQPPGALVPTGWLGRVADLLTQQKPFCVPAVCVGRIECPFALRAQRTMVPSLREYPALGSLTSGFWQNVSTPAETVSQNPLADFLRRSQQEARQMADKLRRHSPSLLRSARYPRFGLARDLLTVAQLIRAQVGIRIFYVELGGGGIGGFDTHAHQAANHGALLREFSASVAAWADDLAQDHTLDRVLMMTFSEFGRTVRENGRRGTDHGAAQPVFLVGGRIRPGLIGTHPNLHDLEADALKPQTDFRRLYRTMLQEWLGLDAKAVLGADWSSTPILQV